MRSLIVTVLLRELKLGNVGRFEVDEGTNRSSANVLNWYVPESTLFLRGGMGMGRGELELIISSHS